jgi:tetratricopeptide (TPR) repeat protein/transcriptional regulator with XRE-family HTH domain
MTAIDPGRIRTRQELAEQLAALFHRGGWSRHRLAEAAGLSPATVQGIIIGATGVPRTGTLEAFVTACGQQPEPWVRARGRIVHAEQAAKADQVPLLGPVNLPFRAQGSFVGRATELADLDAALASPGGVHGLGGIGKSTLAAHWASTRPSDRIATWWITADTRAGIDEGLARLAAALDPECAGQSLEVLAERAVHWLAAHSGWLLILDNVTEAADIEPLLARARGGRFLITSRLAIGWHQITSSVLRLDVLELQEAVELLARIASCDRPCAELDGASELCTELGCLPLAIEQAAAYMYQTGIRPRAYLELLAKYPAVMFGQAAESGDAERTIARIWRITLDRLTDTPLAGHLLRVLAWYAPESIPRAQLDSLADPPRLLQAIGRLAAYNLITTGDGRTLDVHRLVQAVARTSDPSDPHRQSADIQAALHQATRLLNAAVPDDLKQPAEWPAWRELMPHITALTNHAPDDTDTLTTAYLLTAMGLFLADQGAPARAIGLHKRALATLVRARGDDHPGTLSARNNLALAYQAAGDLGEAIQFSEQAVVKQERVLGREHRNTMASRNNLAMAYQAAGDLRRALDLLEQTLTDRERVLGKDSPDTLNSRNSLAFALRSAGDPAV